MSALLHWCSCTAGCATVARRFKRQCVSIRRLMASSTCIADFSLLLRHSFIHSFVHCFLARACRRCGGLRTGSLCKPSLQVAIHLHQRTCLLHAYVHACVRGPPHFFGGAANFFAAMRGIGRAGERSSCAHSQLVFRCSCSCDLLTCPRVLQLVNVFQGRAIPRVVQVIADAQVRSAPSAGDRPGELLLVPALCRPYCAEQLCVLLVALGDANRAKATLFMCQLCVALRPRSRNRCAGRAFDGAGSRG